MTFSFMQGTVDNSSIEDTSCTNALRATQLEMRCAVAKNVDLKAMQTVRREELGSLRLPFLYKLHILLDDMENAGPDHDTISWVEGGKAFKIHKPRVFEKKIQPLYFRQSKMASFVRQCYIYGFVKINSGRSSGAYFHQDFQRGQLAKALSVQRRSKIRDRLQKATYLQLKSMNKAFVRNASKAAMKYVLDETTLILPEISPLERTIIITTPPIDKDARRIPSAMETKNRSHENCKESALREPCSPRCQPSAKSFWVTLLEEAFVNNAFLENIGRVDLDESSLEPRPIELMGSPSHFK